MTKHANTLLALYSLMMVPAFARGAPAPEPPVAGTEPVETSKPVQREEDKYPSNVGAVNEGGGSANTNGMNNGLSPNSSGSGTNNSRAGDTSGIPLGGRSEDSDQPKGTVEQPR